METWIFPNIALLWPTMARSLLQYRMMRLPAAQARAAERELKGAMWPWESAQTGVDCVQFPNPEGRIEIHISGDIPMAFRLYHQLTGDDGILSQSWDLLEQTCEFWVSRAAREPTTGNFTYLNVQPPDEMAGMVNNSVYTNAVASATLKFCLEAAQKLGKAPPPEWAQIAYNIYIPVVHNLYSGPVHPEYTGYHGQDINQADVALLQYPLEWPMDLQLAQNDLTYYQVRSSGPGTSGFYTGDSAYSIAWLRMNNRSAADAQFQLAFKHMDMDHFNVWMEKSFGDGGHLNFLTGAGGYIQNWLYGYIGARFQNNALAFNPVLPPEMEQVTVRAFHYLDCTLTLAFNATLLDVHLDAGSSMYVVSGGGKHWTLLSHMGQQTVSLPPGQFYLTKTKARVARG
eukprot:m.227686 g.227686  ORF g.227686 m.227686 type:complete len:399 (+) comp22373_c0_seq7:137-1333(+)